LSEKLKKVSQNQKRYPKTKKAFRMRRIKNVREAEVGVSLFEDQDRRTMEAVFEEYEERFGFRRLIDSLPNVKKKYPPACPTTHIFSHSSNNSMNMASP
jgi:hypothetical protein